MTKNIKKLFALLLSALLLAGVLPFSAIADTASGVTTVGLEEVEVSANYAYLRIQVLEDSVAVFSNPDVSKFNISSATLLSALKSNNGYELSYVLTEGGEAATVAHVTGGYIKATKSEADDIYIPVVTKANHIPSLSLDEQNLWSETNADGIASTLVSGVGGKSSSDKSRRISIEASGLSGYHIIKLDGNKDSNNTNNVIGWVDNYDTTFTYSVNVMTNTVDMPVAYAYSGHSSIKEYPLISFDSEGYLCYAKQVVTEGNVFKVKTQHKLTPNEWHQIAVSFCSASWIPQIYFDGEYIGCTDAWYDWKVYQLGFGADKSKKGAVYYDDVEYYEGYYHDSFTQPFASLTLSSANESVNVSSDGNVYVDFDALSSASDLLAALSSGAADMSLYTDNTYTAKADVTSDDCMLVLSDDARKVFRYFAIEPILMNIASVSKTPSGAPDTYDISATLTYNATNPKDATMIVVISGADGRFEKIICSDTKAVNGEVTFTVDDVYTAGKKIELFFIDNWSGYIPYYEKQLVE